MLGRDDDELRSRGAAWTAREIAQQPAMLRETSRVLAARAPTSTRFSRRCWRRREMRIDPDRRRHVGLHRRLPGAQLSRAARPAASTRSPTTDLVSAPQLYLQRATSDAAGVVRALGQQPGERCRRRPRRAQCVGAVHHLIVTCNAARRAGPARPRPRNACVHRAAGRDARSRLRDDVELQLRCCSRRCWRFGLAASRRARRRDRAARSRRCSRAQAGRSRARATPASSGSSISAATCFKGLAREAALKLLELTDGRSSPRSTRRWVSATDPRRSSTPHARRRASSRTTPTPAPTISTCSASCVRDGARRRACVARDGADRADSTRIARYAGIRSCRRRRSLCPYIVLRAALRACAVAGAAGSRPITPNVERHRESRRAGRHHPPAGRG